MAGWRQCRPTASKYIYAWCLSPSLCLFYTLSHTNLLPLFSNYCRYQDDISATGAIVRTGAGALGGDTVDILCRPSAAAAAAAAEEDAKECKDSEESKDSFLSPTSSSISRRAAFDAWCSEVNFRARLELRDFCENTRSYVRSLDSRHPLDDTNGAPTYGKNSYSANYTANGDASTTPAHWALTGTYTHPQPGTRSCLSLSLPVSLCRIHVH